MTTSTVTRGTAHPKQTRWIGALIVAVSLAVTSQATAGPWTKNLGEFYVKLGQGAFIANSFRDSSGNLQDGVGYLGAMTSVYFEVGVFRGLQVWGFLPFVVARNSFQESDTRWLRVSGGDAMLGLQYTPHFVKLPFPAALRLEIKVPLYDVNGVDGLYASRFPAPGDGQVDVTLWLSVGGSLSSIPLFFFGEAGYRFRTEAFIGHGSSIEFVDGVTFFGSVGYTFFKRVILAANVGGVIPVKSDSFSKGFITLGPALYVPIWRGLAAEASFDPMVYTNNSAAPGFGFSLGLSFKN